MEQSLIQKIKEGLYLDGLDPKSYAPLSLAYIGRNSKSGSVAKNASMMDYRKATGVEALVGYLYLAGDMDRIIELIGIGFDLNKKEEIGEEHES